MSQSPRNSIDEKKRIAMHVILYSTRAAYLSWIHIAAVVLCCGAGADVLLEPDESKEMLPRAFKEALVVWCLQWHGACPSYYCITAESGSTQIHAVIA